MHVKTHFSIKDLEQLSGVKAHTIRIWEKRYDLLTPSRSETNIRSYSSACLQKLLNVTSLYNDGYKISKIAKFDEEEIAELVREREISNNHTFAIDNLKMAMLAFDHDLFEKTFDQLLEQYT
ncbi:MAG: MerR family transcriptional regulator, partial [Flavobacteriaceae bacterium]|nr:MerR family transcriptional regulator [Flavobacteriaceae bacterium]